MTYTVIDGFDDDGMPTYKDYNNEVEYEIENWLNDNHCSEFDPKGIKYILSIRKKIIDGLMYDNSEVDLEKKKIIIGIEKRFILPAIKGQTAGSIIRSPFNPTNRTYALKFLKLLKDFRQFHYKPRQTKATKKNIGRPKGKSFQTIQRHNWIRDKYFIFKEKRLTGKLNEIAGLIHSELLEKTPKFWSGKIYKKSTILKVLKNKLWEGN